MCCEWSCFSEDPDHTQWMADPTHINHNLHQLNNPTSPSWAPLPRVPPERSMSSQRWFDRWIADSVR